MTIYWKDYKSRARLAKVINSRDAGKSDELKDTCEILYIEEGRATFLSDGYCIEGLKDDSRFYQLKTGDIITINTRGLMFRQFTTQERDACVFITGRCNSNCIMCPCSDSERKGNDGLPEKTLLQYIQMLPEGLPHITVTGGEPTLRTETFFAVMRALAGKFPEAEVLLLTNGRSFASQKIVQRLMEYCPQFLRVAIPIHGSCAELHDLITQTDGSFRQTVFGVHHLLNEGVSVEIRVVVSKKNCHDLCHIADLIIKNFPNPLVVNFVGLEARGNCAKNFRDVFVDLKEAAAAIIPAANQLVKAGIDTALYNFPLCAVDRRYWTLCRDSISPGKIRFPEECASCDVKDYCGGFFNTTLTISKPQVCPVHLERKTISADQSF